MDGRDPGTSAQHSAPIPSRVASFAEARRAWGSRADFYASFYWVGDPLADDVIDAFDRLPRGVGERMLEQALARGISTVPGAPDPLVRLFAHLDDVPPWVDWDRMRRGARAYMRPGLLGGLVLSSVSLMTGYHSHAATKALTFTGRLDRMARRRLAETGIFVYGTFQLDNLRRFAPGFATTVRVRLIHARVRRQLQRSSAWNEAEWGVPINGADLAATNVAFSIALLDACRRLGFRFTQQEAEDLLLLWKYSGYLSGVDVGLLASSEREAMEWGELMVALQPGPDEGSRRLADALRDVYAYPSFGQGPHWKAFMPLLSAYHDGIAHSVSRRDMSELGIPNRAWRHAVPLTRVAITPLEIVRERVPFASYAASWIGNQLWRIGGETMKQGEDVQLAPGEVPAHRAA